MTSISALQSTVNGTSTTSATTDAVSETEDRFMKVLIAQMQNQDPLNPLDNAQITSQLAQLSTVSGINKLNTTLEALQASMTTSQSLQATDMIGHGVFVAGSSVALSTITSTSGTTSMQGVLGANLAGAADSVTLTIRDSSGKSVYTESLGAQTAGILTYAWDGKTTSGTTAAAGKYTFEIAATSAGEKVTATSLSFGEVTSVTNSSTGALLNVNNIGAVTASDVVQIY
jgi:flagellar basal-body rod modification protein FlgD